MLYLWYKYSIILFNSRNRILITTSAPVPLPCLAKVPPRLVTAQSWCPHPLHHLHLHLQLLRHQEPAAAGKVPRGWDSPSVQYQRQYQQQHPHHHLYYQQYQQSSWPGGPWCRWRRRPGPHSPRCPGCSPLSPPRGGGAGCRSPPPGRPAQQSLRSWCHHPSSRHPPCSTAAPRSAPRCPATRPCRSRSRSSRTGTAPLSQARARSPHPAPAQTEI